MAERVEIALVGVGGYGSNYVSAILRDADAHNVSIVAAIDPAIEGSKHRAALQDLGVPFFAGLDEFYSSGGHADLTVVSSPIHTHASLSISALRHGSHVLCEKPVAATVQDARAMHDAAAAAGRFLAVGYQWSFADAVQALKRDIMAGNFGAPVRLKTLCSWPRPASYYERAPWAGALCGPDGEWILDSPVNNATAHYLHNMLYIIGGSVRRSASPVTVQAELYRANRITNYDTGALRCLVEGGAEILFYSTHAVPSNFGPACVYEFEEATVVNDGTTRAQAFTAHWRNGAMKAYDTPDATECNKLWQCVTAARSGRQPVCDVVSAIPQVLCVNASQASSGNIYEFPHHLLRNQQRKGGDSLTWVEGLQGVMTTCFGAAMLPSEVGNVEWSCAGAVVGIGDQYPFAMPG